MERGKSNPSPLREKVAAGRMRGEGLGSLDWGDKAKAKIAAATIGRIVVTVHSPRVRGLVAPTAAAKDAVRARRSACGVHPA